MSWIRTALWACVFWTALGLFFASQIVLLGDGPGGGRVPWSVALRFTMPRWYSWGLLTPAIVHVDRLLRGRSLRYRLAWHVPLGLAWTSLSLALRLAVRPLLGSNRPASLTTYVLGRFYWDVLIYAVIAGVAIAIDYAAQVRRQERQARHLEVQAAELQRLLAEARLHSLRSQLQPHFLFNALNTISALTESEPKTARRLMEQLGHLLRASLSHAATPLLSLAEELTFLDDYLAIEAVRFEGRITVSVRAEDEVLDAMVPSFLLQPLVENAIRHGVAPRLSGGHVEVTAWREGPVLKLRVRDDGVGLSPDWEGPRAGVGLRNLRARLEHQYPGRYAFRVTPRSSGGVDVELDLPWDSSRSADDLVTAAGRRG